MLKPARVFATIHLIIAIHAVYRPLSEGSLLTVQLTEEVFRLKRHGRNL